jgi:hypothetical protein
MSTCRGGPDWTIGLADELSPLQNVNAGPVHQSRPEGDPQASGVPRVMCFLGESSLTPQAETNSARFA